ncbi:MAG TPA: decaprenyl-phosphate phosphoribosyltransferase [bacterium]
MNNRHAVARALVGSLRVRQWVKNALVLAPLVFAGRLANPADALAAAIAGACFCLASSGVYLVNDVLDRRMDRFHPVKRARPVASGAVPARTAYAVAAALLILASLAAVRFHLRLGGIVLLYIALCGAYSLGLKRFVIVDVLALSLGFVMRVWGGAVVLDLMPSHWLQMAVFFLALFVSLAKRRQELLMLHAGALQHRHVLADYTPALIDQMTSVLSGVAIVCYALYAVSPEVEARVGTFGFVYSVPFVVYGVLRYLYLVHVREEGLDPTEALLTDRPMLVSVVLWTLAVLVTLYR